MSLQLSVRDRDGGREGEEEKLLQDAEKLDLEIPVRDNSNGSALSSLVWTTETIFLNVPPLSSLHPLSLSLSLSLSLCL